MKNKIVLALVLIVALFGSCITPKDTNLIQDIRKDYPTDDVAPVDYQIIPGDQLFLEVYTLKESTRTLFSMYSTKITGLNNQNQISLSTGVIDLPLNVLTVYSDGTINIPYIGKVEVQGLTILEAKKVISDKFRAFYPDASVNIVLRNRYFFVLGEAGARSVQMSSLRMNIYQALALSGTVSIYGDKKRVKIVRQTTTGTEVKTFDLRSKDIIDSEFYYIQPNDVIYVQQLQRKFWGSVTSFASIFAFVAGLAGMITMIIKLTR